MPINTDLKNLSKYMAQSMVFPDFGALTWTSNGDRTRFDGVSDDGMLKLTLRYTSPDPAALEEITLEFSGAPYCYTAAELYRRRPAYRDYLLAQYDKLITLSESR